MEKVFQRKRFGNRLSLHVYKDMYGEYWYILRTQLNRPLKQHSYIGPYKTVAETISAVLLKILDDNEFADKYFYREANARERAQGISGRVRHSRDFFHVG